jgi:hypothetical protein
MTDHLPTEKPHLKYAMYKTLNLGVGSMILLVIIGAVLLAALFTKLYLNIASGAAQSELALAGAALAAVRLIRSSGRAKNWDKKG